MKFLKIVVAALLCMAGGTAYAQAQYPSKPVRLIVAYSAGGSTDTLARVLAQKLTEMWGQQVLVENRPGASTIIGAEALAKAAPDGHTIMLVSVDHVITPNLLTTPYDPIKDFAGNDRKTHAPRSGPWPPCAARQALERSACGGFGRS